MSLDCTLGKAQSVALLREAWTMNGKPEKQKNMYI